MVLVSGCGGELVRKQGVRGLKLVPVTILLCWEQGEEFELNLKFEREQVICPNKS